MVGWFTVVTDRDDNSGLALLFAGELRFCGRDFIEPVFNLIPAAFSLLGRFIILKGLVDGIELGSQLIDFGEERRVEVDRRWLKAVVLLQGLPTIVLKMHLRPCPSLSA